MLSTKGVFKAKERAWWAVGDGAGGLEGRGVDGDMDDGDWRSGRGAGKMGCSHTERAHQCCRQRGVCRAHHGMAGRRRLGEVSTASTSASSSAGRKGWSIGWVKAMETGEKRIKGGGGGGGGGDRDRIGDRFQ
eukprot:scaffold31227_cov215-Amphora_coffeaeformis.AAC.1